MNNSIVIDYMKKVDTSVGKCYIQISEDILYDTYHGRLPVFFVEDMNNICKVVGNGLLHNRRLSCTF